MDGDAMLLERLRNGDEEAFVALVTKYHETMVRLACSFVPSKAVAEEVAQDTWLGVVRGIDRFEGRSSLRTWLLRILVNKAKSAGTKERRTMPMGDAESAVNPTRFDGSGMWATPPAHWADSVDDRLTAESFAKALRAGLDDLPPMQRDV